MAVGFSSASIRPKQATEPFRRFDLFGGVGWMRDWHDRVVAQTLVVPIVIMSKVDNEQGKLKRLCPSRYRPEVSVCEGTRISKIRRIAPGVRSSSGFEVASEATSRLHVAGKHETTYRTSHRGP